MLRAGSLNRRITIQSQATTQDAYGQQVNTWDDLLTCWASIKAVTSKEVYAASGYTSQVSHKITIRYPTVAISSKMRVLYETRLFHIQAINDPSEGREQLDLLCLEVDDGS
ncbi:phage head closure protein [Terriglobus roseus]|uniref:Phage head-tail adaptor, putative, SPP1 family n=1 Tax=Terriglobus roseus TaxID=392734 RepID=A0A1H4J341_9BACT|nr:phage head closure protein [Terriglobus roseus]SEB40714.1 phage head-tail adaptor, putative, SPP1 family [Terriglobus roseus]